MNENVEGRPVISGAALEATAESSDQAKTISAVPAGPEGATEITKLPPLPLLEVPRRDNVVRLLRVAIIRPGDAGFPAAFEPIRLAGTYRCRACRKDLISANVPRAIVLAPPLPVMAFCMLDVERELLRYVARTARRAGMTKVRVQALRRWA